MLHKMKILFVCRANVARSQMAAAYYNQQTKTSDAASAGTIVDKPGESLEERRREHKGTGFAVDVMADQGIDISGKLRARLAPEDIKNYDRIINMADPKYCPDWLLSSPNYEYWQVEDPMNQSYEVTAGIRDIIKQKVLELIAKR